MKYELHDFDIFPMVFLTGREQKITIRSKNRRFLPEGEHEYTVLVSELAIAEDNRFAGGECRRSVDAVSAPDGSVTFSMTFEREGEYYVWLKKRNEGDIFAHLNVYALAPDMAGRYPLRGDLHMHSNYSDGHDDVISVVSNYRGHGYDFTVVSDHGRYYSSLKARNAFDFDDADNSPLTNLLIVRGEEVHLPCNDVHYVNFGGRYSLNALITPNSNEEAGGDAPEWRSADGTCPPTMTRDEFIAMISERAKSVDRELESERMSYAVLEWTYEHMQKNGGLGIFPHPYWRCSTMQLSEDYTRYIYEKKPFDAFEVLGGENYYQHNGYQTSFYYEERVKGFDPPVVGSTDSHGSTENNRNALICSTIVFAPKNTTISLIDSIKDKYSVAVDSISKEYRLVGDFRFVKFGSFLMENWYPIHDLACRAEGYYMREYAYGNEQAGEVLKAMKGQMPSMFEKYFDMD